MNENISNSFTILKNFIEMISKKSNTHDGLLNTHDIQLNALEDLFNNNIEPNIDELNSYIGELNTKYNNLENNISNNKVELEEYRVNEDTHYYSLNL